MAGDDEAFVAQERAVGVVFAKLCGHAFELWGAAGVAFGFDRFDFGGEIGAVHVGHFAPVGEHVFGKLHDAGADGDGVQINAEEEYHVLAGACVEPPEHVQVGFVGGFVL